LGNRVQNSESCANKNLSTIIQKKRRTGIIKYQNLLYSQRFTIDGAKKQLHKIRNNDEPGLKDNEKQKLFLMRIKKELQQIKEIIS